MELPQKITGTVIKGFNRGGKQLGFPTANLDLFNIHQKHIFENNDNLLEILEDENVNGVYYGWCYLNKNKKDIYQMVMSKTLRVNSKEYWMELTSDTS